MKKIIIILGVVVIIGIIGYFAWQQLAQKADVSSNENDTPVVTPTSTTDGTNEAEDENKTETIIGKSADGTDIVAYHYGEGDTELLFVGGIHGGYSWNTALVAYELSDYLKENSNSIPENVKVTVIPVLNPDGLEKVVGMSGEFEMSDVSTSESVLVSGRFNGNDVDLNRNFDCDWQSSGTWQNRAVSGGTSAFSEPESAALRDYVEAHTPDAVVAWYSSAGGVYASNCHDGVSAETRAIMNEYARASGYSAHDDFNFYEITGDMMNWLAKEDIPAISILLTDHENTEWNKNLAGIKALFKYYEDQD